MLRVAALSACAWSDPLLRFDWTPSKKQITGKEGKKCEPQG
jgi:hypothetical protein